METSMNTGTASAVAALLSDAGLPGLLSLTPLDGGYANDLYRVTLSGPPHSVVARVWRRAPAQAATELAVMRLASDVVAVPEVLASDLSGPRPAALLRDVPGLDAERALRLYPDEAGEIGRVLGEAFGRLNRLRLGRAGFFSGPDLGLSPWPDTLPSQMLLDYSRPLIWNDVARTALGPDTAERLWQLTAQHAPLLDALAGEAHLVHADANPKNVVVQRTPDGWQLGAVLDWEFAFSGASLTDLGNLLRFEARGEQGTAASSPYGAGVIQGWAAGGGDTPEGFLAMARTLDLYSLLEFVNRPEAALHPAAVALIRRTVASGHL